MVQNPLRLFDLTTVAWVPPGVGPAEGGCVLEGLACWYVIPEEGEDDAPENVDLLNDECMFCIGLSDDFIVFGNNDGSQFGREFVTFWSREDGAAVGSLVAGDCDIGDIKWIPAGSGHHLRGYEELVARLETLLG